MFPTGPLFRHLNNERDRSGPAILVLDLSADCVIARWYRYIREVNARLIGIRLDARSQIDRGSSDVSHLEGIGINLRAPAAFEFKLQSERRLHCRIVRRWRKYGDRRPTRYASTKRQIALRF